MIRTTKDLAVAIIEPVGGHGGMDYYDLGLCRGLLAAGFRVSLYTCDETTVPNTPGLRFFPFYKRIYGDGARWARACRFLAGTLAVLAKAVASREKICHFHVFHGAITELGLVLLAKLCRRRIVITVHDVESFGDPRAVNLGAVAKIYRFADRLIVHNRFSFDELVEKLAILPPKVRIIPHGNYLGTVGQTPDRAEARRALGISEAKRVVLFFGQIKDTKGLDIMLESAPEVIRSIPEVWFLIAGRPWKSDFKRYEALIHALDISNRCTLHIRFIPDQEVARYYAAANVVVLPYRRIYQSGVILMAMSHGRPVVVSDLPGMTEIVTDGQNGYVFAEGSKTELSKVLVHALENARESEEVAGRALTYVQKNHDWEQIGRKTGDLYRELVPS